MYREYRRLNSGNSFTVVLAICECGQLTNYVFVASYPTWPEADQHVTQLNRALFAW